MSRKRAATEAERPAKKERAPFYLPVEVIEQARNAAFWTPGLTLAALGERAMRRELARLERQRGEAFPKRRAPLRVGRPIATR